MLAVTLIGWDSTPTETTFNEPILLQHVVVVVDAVLFLPSIITIELHYYLAPNIIIWYG